MDNIFVISGIISFTFFIAKFIEMRFIEKESKPLKLLIRDSLLVDFSVIVSYFIIDQLKSVIPTGGDGVKLTPIFTDNPNF
jgi:hypothetical protein